MIENRQTGEVGAWQRGMITCLSLSVLSQTLSSVAILTGTPMILQYFSCFYKTIFKLLQSQIYAGEKIPFQINSMERTVRPAI